MRLLLTLAAVAAVSTPFQADEPARKSGIEFALDVKDPAAPKLTLHFKTPPPDALILLTLICLAGETNVGIYQRFEEEGTWPGEGVPRTSKTYRLPDLPPGTTSARVSFRTCPLDLDALRKDEWSRKWYTHSWSHFTTAKQLKDGCTFEFWTRPIDSDLERWLKESGIEFRQGCAESATIVLSR